MGLTSLFRKPPPMRTFGELEPFVERNAAFLVQKCIFEYARARAGILSQDLFKEEAFKTAVERSRWLAFPIGVRLVVEMVEGRLRPLAGDPSTLIPPLLGLAEAVLGRQEAAQSLPEPEWRDAAEAAAARIRRLQLAAPKPVKDIPIQDAQEMFDLMPIHKSLMGHDFELLQNNVRVNLCRIHEDFLAAADLPALAADAGGRAYCGDANLPSSSAGAAE